MLTHFSTQLAFPSALSLPAHTCTHVSICEQHACTHMYSPTHTHTHSHPLTHTFTHSHTPTHTLTHTPSHTHILSLPHTHTYTGRAWLFKVPATRKEMATEMILKWNDPKTNCFLAKASPWGIFKHCYTLEYHQYSVSSSLVLPSNAMCEQQRTGTSAKVYGNSEFSILIIRQLMSVSSSQL